MQLLPLCMSTFYMSAEILPILTNNLSIKFRYIPHGLQFLLNEQSSVVSKGLSQKYTQPYISVERAKLMKNQIETVLRKRLYKMIFARTPIPILAILRRNETLRHRARVRYRFKNSLQTIYFARVNFLHKITRGKGAGTIVNIFAIAARYLTIVLYRDGDYAVTR